VSSSSDVISDARRAEASKQASLVIFCLVIGVFMGSYVLPTINKALFGATTTEFRYVVIAGTSTQSRVLDIYGNPDSCMVAAQKLVSYHLAQFPKDQGLFGAHCVDAFEKVDR
jgi:hypothetical protein